MKGKRGITLIALIITIIVMLILVTVSVNIAISGELFGTTKKAVRKTDIAQLMEDWMIKKDIHYNITTGDVDISDGTLESVFGDKYKQYNDQFAIENGELVYIGTDETMKQYATELGIDLPLWNEAKRCNAPKLMTGMTPIIINTDREGSISETTADDPNWYNYTNKEWANAKTKDGSMWVWIPRFAYKINEENYNRSTAGTIDITFLKNRNTTAEGKTIVNASGAGNWNIHPAFKFGDKELEGIWVAKFEASRSDATESGEGTSETMKIQYGVRSWRNITVNDIFNKCKNAKYGGTANLGSHMMKNSEWGAVAYLTQSQYGKNEKVYPNTDSNYLTGGGHLNQYLVNVAQSTTGNRTGIYDMSGGASEYVAAYVGNNTAGQSTGGLTLVQSKEKYKDVYSWASGDNSNNNYFANYTKYGDAVFETSNDGEGNFSWFGETSVFPADSHPFFIRGGAGLFSYSGGYAGAVECDGFRPVLVPL